MLVLLGDFFKTRSTWAEVYGKGNSWNWFGLTHILILLVTVVFCVVMSYLYKNADEAKRKVLRLVLVGLMLAEEVWMFSISFATNQFEMGFLPLHLCGINIFFCMAYTIKPKEWIADMLYGLALPGAFLALIVPTWTGVPAWNFIFIFSTGYHIFLICYPIMLLAGGFKPNFKNLKKVGLTLVILCAVIFGINELNYFIGTKTNNLAFWKTNFMFLHEPESVITTVANLLGLKGRSFLIVLPVMLVLIWGLFYTPWILIDKKNKKLEENQ